MGEDNEAEKQEKTDQVPRIERNDELTAFIQGLSFDVTEEKLRKDFSEYGEVTRLFMPKKMMEDPRDKLSCNSTRLRPWRKRRNLVVKSTAVEQSTFRNPATPPKQKA